MIKSGPDDQFEKNNHMIQSIVPKDVRLQFKFLCKDVPYRYEGVRKTFPCICLCEIETKLIVSFTGLERYLVHLAEATDFAGSYMHKKAINVCGFLNYVLYETDIRFLHQCTSDTIRKFLIFSKEKEDGKLYAKSTWIKRKDDVIDFLYNYWFYNHKTAEFSYSADMLKTCVEVKRNEKFKPLIMVENKKFNVSPPQQVHTKNRLLVYEYLELLIYEARKYEPMIALGIALQSYAGIREGEVVNLGINSIKLSRKSFGVLSSIEIDLSRDAAFLLNTDKKINRGTIKKYRTQKVYDDFLSDIEKLFNEHLRFMSVKGYPIECDAPLFLNAHGKPMSVQTYSGRVKKLFYEHFLPNLIRYCEKTNTLDENIAFIESYEEEYPGAHMFRHWFTMYLLTKAKLSDGEIMKWRGDASLDSMIPYLHENKNLINLYEMSSFIFQESILEGIDE